MTFKDRFCPSPWFHLQINNSGRYEYCRWSDKRNRNRGPSIQEQTPLEFFQQGMAPVRQSMLNGETVADCGECYLMDQHSKVSGRQRQLLKIGARLDDFTNTMLSSPWLGEFKSTQDREGVTQQTPQDWQVDLGNYCNSGCIFCNPDYSSRLATEFIQLKLISQTPSANWCEDPVKFNRFLDSLRASKHIKYIHFIGGETLITPAFKRTLEALINENLQHTITIGFTTNLTVWDQTVIDLLVQFKQINLGMSIECIHPLNDYVRYGSTIGQATDIMDQWLTVAREKQWLVQLRVTPNIFTIYHLDTVYEYAYQKNLAVESCNFLDDPAFMKPSVLPMSMRKPIIDKLTQWVNEHNVVVSGKIVNTRNPDFAQQQIVEDANSYISYLKNQPDESERLPALVEYLKLLESSRKNQILDYIPEYEELLRSAGY